MNKRDGFLYGAGDSKIAEIVNGTKEDGAKLRAKFLKNIPALKQLIAAVTERAKTGKIKAIDGRTLSVRHRHAALNTLLQSAGSIASKYWIIYIHDILKERGYVLGKDYIQHAYIHDEAVISYSSRLTEEELTEVSRLAIQRAGEKLNCRIPLDISACIGDNYSEVH